MSDETDADTEDYSVDPYPTFLERLGHHLRLFEAWEGLANNHESQVVEDIKTAAIEILAARDPHSLPFLSD